MPSGTNILAALPTIDDVVTGPRPQDPVAVFVKTPLAKRLQISILDAQTKQLRAFRRTTKKAYAKRFAAAEQDFQQAKAAYEAAKQNGQPARRVTYTDCLVDRFLGYDDPKVRAARYGTLKLSAKTPRRDAIEAALGTILAGRDIGAMTAKQIEAAKRTAVIKAIGGRYASRTKVRKFYAMESIAAPANSNIDVMEIERTYDGNMLLKGVPQQNDPWIYADNDNAPIVRSWTVARNGKDLKIDSDNDNLTADEFCYGIGDRLTIVAAANKAFFSAVSQLTVARKKHRFNFAKRKECFAKADEEFRAMMNRSMDLDEYIYRSAPETREEHVRLSHYEHKFGLRLYGKARLWQRYHEVEREYHNPDARPVTSWKKNLRTMQKWVERIVAKPRPMMDYVMPMSTGVYT